MTNADRIRTFSNEQLALTIMCPNDACLADIECPKSDNELLPASGKYSCVKCTYDWLNSEEVITDETAQMD